MTRRTFVLVHAEARKRAQDAIAAAPEGYVVTLAAPKRSGDQNAALHALLGDIAERITWAGSRQTIETWKRLLVASWCRATGQPVVMLPALDGQGVDIVFRRTSELTRAECLELLDFVGAWASEHGIEDRR